MAEEKTAKKARVPYKDPRKERTENNKDVGKVIAVVSGKGGVGKSLITSMLAVESVRRGHSTGIMDIDITGPSIPKSFGLHGRLLANADGTALIPAETRTGIKVVSMNLLIGEEQPVIWRGPIISGTVGEFWPKTVWGKTAGNRRCSAYAVSDCPGSRNCRGDVSAGSGVPDCGESCKHGQDDERADSWNRGEHVVFRLPELRSETRDLRREPCG